LIFFLEKINFSKPLKLYERQKRIRDENNSNKNNIKPHSEFFLIEVFFCQKLNERGKMATAIMNKSDVKRTITRLAHEILEKNKGAENLVIVGIFTRGVHLAKRIKEKINEIENTNVSYGELDITLYRDDYDTNVKAPTAVTSIPNTSKKTVVLIDDVLFTGRTIRAAMDGIMEFGRPKKIQLAILIDRGHRELPIKADFVGKNMPTSLGEKVKVHLQEEDGQDKVIVEK
jgi:pyrimidine operon attenuation protein/uracil phosphoribosyltransferase